MKREAMIKNGTLPESEGVLPKDIDADDDDFTKQVKEYDTEDDEFPAEAYYK